MVNRDADRDHRRLLRSERFRPDSVTEPRPVELDASLDEPSVYEVQPALSPRVDCFGGNAPGTICGDPAGDRQRDRAEHELRGHGLRGFAGGFPQTGDSGTCRPDPGDSSFAFSDLLDDPKKFAPRRYGIWAGLPLCEGEAWIVRQLWN